MIAALIIASVLAGLFAGYAVHTLHELREAKYELSGYRQEELRYTDEISHLREQLHACETSLTLVLKEICK